MWIDWPSWSFQPRHASILAGVMLLATTQLQAQQDSAAAVGFGAFVDTYFAYQLRRGNAGDIAFLTQPARNREFNLNLAFVEAKLSGSRLRGRLALQAGTSVQSNYSGEPGIGSTSGPDLARHIQEAVVGYQVFATLWVDAGIYLSHIGSEGWISRDNWTYTRSLIADYSPYYEAGVRVTWSPSAKLTASVNLINGWQNISETNDDKAFGARLDFAPSSKLTLSYSNFIGNEKLDNLDAQIRFFHDFIAKLIVTDRLGFLGTFDYGTEAGNSWYGLAAIVRLRTSRRVFVVGRFERYADEQQVILRTGGGKGFVGNGFSVGIDVAPAPRLLWRSELRSLHADTELFPRDIGPSRNAAFVVSSFALTF